MTFNVSIDPQSAMAKESLKARFTIGLPQQAALVRRVSELHIKDKLVSPKGMHFHCTTGKLRLSYDPFGEQVVIHPHALSQLYTASGFRAIQAKEYFSIGTDWAHDLIAYNMNELFHKRSFLDRQRNPKRFLHRLVKVGDTFELRGFLSRNYNRMLASLPLLRGFMEASNAVGAQPLEASTSDVFFSLKCFLPHVFEPVPGEYVAFGMKWSNSDFGYGRLSVGLCAMRIVGGGAIVFEDALSRRHIGSVIQDSDLEISEETARKEVEAQLSAINDIVTHLLSPTHINKMVNALGIAAQMKIPWGRMKSELGGILAEDDLKKLQELCEHDSIDLPPPAFLDDGSRVPTRWWAATAISRIANNESNPDRKAELQAAAGNMMKLDHELLSSQPDPEAEFYDSFKQVT